MSDRTYIEIPGDRTHELPPLLIHGEASGTRLDEMVGRAADIVDTEDLLPSNSADESVVEQRKYDLALQLAEQYLGVLDSVVATGRLQDRQRHHPR